MSQSPYDISYGPDANCTLAICDVNRSVYGYQPSIPANASFIALFAVNLILHAVQGWLYPKQYLVFAIPMVLGGIDEIIGYSGRIMLYNNPFSFAGFLIQIICITTAPVFYCAAIYVTLAKIVRFLGTEFSRFQPALFYWLFIPCDILSLTLQATGGAMSSASTGRSQVGVNISLAGLSFQVFTLLVFVVLSVDYALRWKRASRTVASRSLARTRKFQIFIAFLALATLLIIGRCIYRIDELSEGYTGPLIGDEGLFIGLEGVLIVVSAFCLNVGHPGYGLETHSNIANSRSTQQQLQENAGGEKDPKMETSIQQKAM